MKHQKIQIADREEMEILKNQLDSRDLFLIGFLKGFNRSNMKEWAENDLSVFNSSNY